MAIRAAIVVDICLKAPYASTGDFSTRPRGARETTGTSYTA